MTARPAQALPPRFTWLGPLLVGLTFALGYGITDRLLRLNLGGWVPLGQNFDHRPAPGTTLESLRQRSGDLTGSVRGDLEAVAQQQALERQAAQEAERMQPLEPDPASAADPETAATAPGPAPAALPLPADTAAPPSPARPANPAPARPANPAPARIPAPPAPVPPP